MKKNNVAGLIVGGSVLPTLLILLSGFILSMNKVSGRDIDDGQQIGHSIFTLYNGNIYAGVPSDGQYVIVCLFEDNSSQKWEKTGDVMNHRYGEVWKKGNKYYYFDRLGTTQLVSRTIYEITGKQARSSLLNDNLRPENIRQMTGNGSLQPVTCTSVLQAKTYYKKTFMSALDIFNDD
ncbi:MAG: hypothetical protein RR510_14545 [Morganella sp. (in: enterobacteria)]